MDLFHLPVLCSPQRQPEAYRLRLPIFGVPVGIEPQPAVSARHDHGRGVPKTHRPDSKTVESQAGENHLRLFVSPASQSKAGTQTVGDIQSGRGAQLRPAVFKIKWRNLTLKIYDKGGRVLRIEVVVHN